MKPRLLLLLFALSLSIGLSAQTYRYQYSHDTLGNRTSRVYQGVYSNGGDDYSKKTEYSVESKSDGPADAGSSSTSYDIPSLPAVSETDTTRLGPVYKSPAEKEAYQRLMMEKVMALKPLDAGDEGKGIPGVFSVGEVPLQYGVSGSGARTYSVPILTAPDVKYAPSLSLSYNSQGGHGYGGYGWDIGGLSAITLTGQTLYWNDTIQAASVLDTTGVFCLDGVRLVTNDDAATCSSYPLVTASGHVLVAPHRNARRFITSFTALYPDGSRATFGTGADLGFTLPSFPIASSFDIEGNHIEYSYSLDTVAVCHSIDSVRYGFDATGTAAATIRFTSVQSSTYSYYAGKKVKRSPRLTSIVSSSDGVDLYTYSLIYSQTAGVPLLIMLDLRNHLGRSLPPLLFTYGVSNPPHTGTDSLKIVNTLSLSDYFEPDKDVIIYRRGKFVPGSYNDGLLTYAYLPTYSQVGTNVFACNYPATYPLAFGASFADVTPVSAITAETGFQTAEAVDVDGDGIDEVVKVCCGATTASGSNLIVKVYRYNTQNNLLALDATYNILLQGSILDGTSTYSPYLRTFHWGDFLGNGKAQLLVVTPKDNGFYAYQAPYVSLIDLSSGTKLSDDIYPGAIAVGSGQQRRLLCIDIDGDSRNELCVATTSGLNVYRCRQDGSFIFERTLPGVTSSIIDSDKVYYSDINADGYIDIITSAVAGPFWEFYMNTGNGFEYMEIPICSVSSADRYMFIDIDRDGYPDLVRASGITMGFFPNVDGLSFDSFKSAHITPPSLGGMLPANVVDYTDMCSFVWVQGSYVNEYGYTTYTPEIRQLVQSKDSYGKVVRNTYGYLPQESLYWTENPAGISAAGGYQLRVLPIYVLTGAKGTLSSDSNAQIFLQDTYAWCDGVVNTKGLGFCGFSKTRTEARLDNVTHTSVSRFNPQKKGVLVSLSEYRSSDHYPPFSVTEYTYDNHSTTYGKLSPRLTYSLNTNTVTGVTSGAQYYYDSFDFPVKVFSYKASSGNYVSDVSYTTYIHSNSAARYRLGVVAAQVTLSERDRDPDFYPGMGSRTVFSYDTLFRPVSRSSYRVISTPPDYLRADWSRLSREQDGLRSIDTLPYVCHLVSRERWQYDSHGNVIREESAPSGSNVFIGTSSTYDASGRHMVSSTDALGHTTTYSGFDVYGNPSVVTNHKGQQTHAYRDGWGRVTRTVHPDGTVDSLARAWGGSGAYTETSLSSGAPDVVVDYDAAGRKVLSSQKRFDGQWQKVAKQYDERGNIKKASLPYRGASPSYWNTYYYDSHSRPTSLKEASGRKTTWSYSGSSTTERKDGVRVTRTLNPAGDLYSVADSLSTITYYYRDDGQPASVSATGGAVTTFSYDTLGRRTAIVDPSAGTRSTSYLVNADGSSVVTQTNALGSIVTSTDSLGRTTSIVRPDFNTVFAYDTCGRLISSVSTNGTCARYTYDSYDRLLTAKDSVPDGKWLQKAYTYNADGNVSSIAFTSQGGYITTESYAYANGHNTAITLPDNTVVYSLSAENEFGLPTSATSGGVTRTYGYTAYGLPTYRKLNGGSLMDQGYSFDAATGNLLSRSYKAGAGTATTESFSYDDLARLTSAAGNNITYDALNNITGMGGNSMSYSADAHPYAMTGLDAASTAGMGTAQQSISYTAYDRPATITQGDKSAAFTYNANHDRARMIVSRSDGDLTRYYIGGRYERHEDSLDETIEILYLGGDAYSAPMVLYKHGNYAWTPYVIGRDYLGSINTLSLSGSIQEGHMYGAWGGGSPSIYLGRGWCGHEYLEDFGLINMNARLYDPVLGRFLSPDPYVQAHDIPGNFNRYSYCLNNPLKYTDESGEIFGTIFGVISDLINNIFVRSFKEQEWDWTQTKWGWEIDKGLFLTDPNKSDGGRAWEFISRLTWQLPQTLLGDIYVSTANAFGKVNNVTHGYGVTAVDKGTGGAVTLGFYSAGSEGYTADWKNHKFVHEYGHYIQSQYFGLVFLPVIGGPSIMSAGISTDTQHRSRWFEANASRLGANYFDKYYGAEAEGYYVGSPYHFNKANFETGKDPSYANPMKYESNYIERSLIGEFNWSDILIYTSCLLIYDYSLAIALLLF